ncbi:MAG: RluA family pseudouridine synthase [Proteobacteria bacterium]|nr:RluA family pseudouridine synthase [Pseudomonadota bacterium]
MPPSDDRRTRPNGPIPHRVKGTGHGRELLDYVAETFTSTTREELRAAIDAGRFRLKDGPILSAASELKAGQTLLADLPPKTVSDPWRGPVPKTLPLLFKDDDVVVADKAAGLLSYPMGPRKDAAQSIVQDQLFAAGEPWELRPSHRLDRETSGVLMWTRNLAADQIIKETFKKRRVSKTYLALVRGTLERATIVDAPMRKDVHGPIRVRQVVARDGKPAQTSLTPLGWFGSWTWVECQPITGRTHQIRVHLAHIGHPIVGDKIYCDDGISFRRWWDGDLDDSDLRRLGMKRQALHAWTMSVAHPGTGEPLDLAAPVPADMAAFARERGGTPPTER